jgi:hypothetical protein
MMNVNLQLIENKVIRNYKELCSLLDLKVKGGTAKIAQLNELSRYIKFTKIKNSYKFYNIYENALPSCDKRKEGNNRIDFIKDIYKLILKFLDNKEVDFVISKSALLNELNMINDRYIYYKYHIKELHEDYEIPDNEINHFYSSSYNLLNRCLNNVITILDNKALAFVNENYMIIFIDKDKNTQTRLANEEEIKQILHCQRLALNALRYDSIQDVVINNNFERFNKLALRFIDLKDKNVQSFYKVLKFVVKKEDLREVVITLYNETEEELKKVINNNICDRLKNNTEKRYKNKPHKYKSDYIENQNKCIELLVMNSVIKI